MKAKIIIGSGLILSILVGLSIYLIHTHRKENKLIVSVDNLLSLDKIHIEQGFYSINESSDAKLLKIGLDKVIYSNGKKSKIETTSGEIDFLVIYANEYYAIFRHYISNKFNNTTYESNTYIFNFNKIGNHVKLTLNIIGENGKIYETTMSKISDGNKNIRGVKIKNL